MRQIGAQTELQLAFCCGRCGQRKAAPRLARAGPSRRRRPGRERQCDAADRTPPPGETIPRFAPNVPDSSSTLIVSHLVVKPGFGHPQIPSHRDGRNLENLSNFFHRKPAEVAQFDCLGFPLVKLLKCLKSKIEGDEFRSTLSAE